MKLILTGDWHLTDKTPRCRVDDYPSTQMEKIQFVFDSAKLNGCEFILQPGDLTDKFIARDSFKTDWINFFNRNMTNTDDPNLISVWGQHDMRYHTSNINDTPLGVLRAGAGFNIIEDDQPKIFGDVHIYGAGWGMPIPKILMKNKFNILIAHRMIVTDKLWFGQEKYEVAGSFLRKYNFDLVVSGDNHNKFVYEQDNKTLINCGSIMRSEVNQVSHKPAIFIFNTNSSIYSEISIPIKPFESVANLNEYEKEEIENERLNKLKDELKKKGVHNKKDLDYRKRVSRRVDELKKAKAIDIRTESFIGRIMADE